MNALNTLNLRPSDIVLDKLINPGKSKDFKNARAIDMMEACGIIPEFFAEACLQLEYDDSTELNLDNIAAAMDNIYQCGGFQYAMKGTVSEDGSYISSYEDDYDMPAICRFGYEGRYLLYVYDSAITALVDNVTGVSKIGRFD